MRLQNKIAIVTGSSSGMRRGVALAFAREGAAAVVNCPDQTRAQAARHCQRQTLSPNGGDQFL